MRTTPIKRNTPLHRSSRPISRSKRIRKETPEHRAGQVEWKRLKAAVITEQLEAFDWAGCEDCDRRFYTLEAAMDGLHAHHVTFRSQGGKNERKNMSLLCPACHEAIHSRRAVNDTDMPPDAGGFDAELGEE